MPQNGGMDTLAVLAAGPPSVVLRTATRADVSAIVDLIAADQLGATRDGVRDEKDLAAYAAAFQSIEADPAHLPLVAEQDGQISGVGAAMMRWAISEAQRRGCSLVQLTTDKARADAHRFYARLGFVASHEGMKLAL
jgi:GNAT superfamily N-acetyltransferase